MSDIDIESQPAPETGAESSSRRVQAPEIETSASVLQRMSIGCRPEEPSATLNSASAIGLADDASNDVTVPEEEEHLTPALEHISILSHLAVFAMLGVLIRYGAEILFGPYVLHVTDNEQALFLDVPSNMIGSFLMGVVGFSTKKYIAEYSQPLAIGLSTGLCGSITTFASWNQRMVAILAYGYVFRGLFGYILGVATSIHSFQVGTEVGHGICQLAARTNEQRVQAGQSPWSISPEHYSRRWHGLLICCSTTIILWVTAAVGFALSTQEAKLKKLSLACMVGPFGCWVRWYLSKLNGGGIGRDQRWKWVPVGTLAANITAAGLENITSVCDAIYNTPTGSIVVGGLQLGFMGCMSTVSAFMQEFHILLNAKSARWRGYVYVYGITILPSVVIGILLYCTPVWIHGVQYNGYNQV